MAVEYSRELSGKVWAGNRRIAELGYHIGASQAMVCGGN